MSVAGQTDTIRYAAPAAPGVAVPPQCLGDAKALGPTGPQLRVGFLEMGGGEGFWGLLGLLPRESQRSLDLGTCFCHTCAL